VLSLTLNEQTFVPDSTPADGIKATLFLHEILLRTYDILCVTYSNQL